MSSLPELKKQAKALKIKGRGRMKKADLAVAIALAKQSVEGGSMVGGAARTTTAPAVGARMQRQLPLDAPQGGSMVGGAAKVEKPFLCDCCAANLHGAGLFDFMSNVSRGIRGTPKKAVVARKMKRMAAAEPRAPVFNSGDLESFIGHS